MKLYSLLALLPHFTLRAAAQSAPSSTVTNPNWNPTNSTQWGIFAGCAVAWNEISEGDFNIGNAGGGSDPEILCYGCTDISPDIQSCCSDYPSGDCLPGGTTWRAVVSAESTGVKSYTAANWAACSAISAAFGYCQLSTADFYNLPLSAQSSCLCNNPVQKIDNYVTMLGFGVVASQCYGYLQSNEPSYAAGFSTTLLDLCPVTAAATGTAASTATGAATPASTATQGAAPTSTAKSASGQLSPQSILTNGLGGIAFVASIFLIAL